MIIGILWGIYLKNIFLIFFILLIYSIPIKNRNLRKLKRVYVNKKCFIIFIITVLIFNIYVLALEYKHDNLLKNISYNINIKGVVISNCEESEYTYKYIVRVLRLNNIKLTNVNLIIYTKKNKNILEYGDIIEFSGEYSKHNQARNYKGFDYEEYAKKDNIYGSCKVDEINIIGKKKGTSNIFNSINMKISNNLRAIFAEKEAEILIGIILGNKDNIDDNIIEYFRNSSLSHILAVSGTHISYIILGINICLNYFKVNKKMIKIITILLLILFLGVVGFSPSVVRAVIMSIIMISSGLFHRKSETINSMNISMIVILIYNPYYIKDIGILLSYGGVIGIVIFFRLFEQALKKLWKKNKFLIYLKEMILLSISVQIIILPITILYFNSVSTLFFISNILVLPLVGITIILTLILILISFVNIKFTLLFSSIISMIIKLIILISKTISEIPFSNFLVCTPHIIYVVLYYFFIGILYICYMQKCGEYRVIKFNYKNVIKKAINIIFIIIICLNIFQKLFNRDLNIHFIDVGQRRFNISHYSK